MPGLSLGLGLGLSAPSQGVGVGVGNLIAPGDNGFAVDFVSGRMAVQDSVTPANTYSGPLAGKMTVVGSLPASADGVRLDASNFGRIAVAAWPYSPTAFTIAGQIKYDTSLDAAARTLYSIDTGGNDRLQAVALAATDKISMSVGTGASAVNVTAATSIPADTWFDFVGVSGPLGTFILINGALSTSNAAVLAASNPPQVHNGIGVLAAATGNAVAVSPMLGRARRLTVLGRAVPRDVALNGLPFATKVLLALGDSHTFNAVYSLPNEFYVKRAAAALGSQWFGRNYGVSGHSTAEMMGRVALTVEYGNPDIAVVYGGTNDGGATKGDTAVEASPTPTSTVFTIDATATPYYAAGGYITVGGESARVLSLAGDQLTLTSALSGGAPAAGTVVLIDTQKNLEEIVAYYQARAIPRIVVMGQHYLNFASGGDTTSVQRADLLTLRTKQAAAAAAKGVPYVDNYAFMRQRILDGVDVQGSESWHYAPGDTHLNAYGQSILALALGAALSA